MNYLASLDGSDCETEEGGDLGVALHLELRERGCVALDGLAALALNTVQLHRSHHTVLLRTHNYTHVTNICCS